MSQQQQLSPIIQNLLAAVKKHSQLNDDINSSSEAFMERRQLRTQILDSFKSWIENNNDDDDEDEKNRKQNEIIVVAEACRQIVQLRLTLGVHNGGDNNDNNENDDDTHNASTKMPENKHQEAEESSTEYFSNDSTLNLVLDCADIFVLTRKSNLNNNISNNVASPSALEPWKNFIVFLCTNPPCPLEVSLRGFQLLVKWILGQQPQRKKEDEGENQTFLSKCLGLINSDANNNNNNSKNALVLTPGVLMSRLSSVLQEKFSVDQTKKFCLSTGFHQILQKDGLISVHYSDVNNKNKNNSNTATKAKREKRDALTIATIFSSIGYVVKCCGPQALEEQVAIILASYLIRLKEDDGVDYEDSDSQFERQILKPFVHQTISEMFQRGVNYHHQETGGENKNDKNQEEAETEQERTFSWSNYCDDELRRNIKSVSILASALLKSILLPENSSDNESIELWTRSVAAMSSSFIGLQTLALVEKEEAAGNEILASANNNNNSTSSTATLSFQAKMAAIVKQMLRSSASSGSTAVKIIALNTVQSSAVPLAEDMKAALSKLSTSSSKNCVLLLLQQIIRQSSSLLQQLLFSLPSSSDVDNNNASSFFASVLLPLGTRQATLFSSSNTNEEDSVGDAFWTMIEQLVVAPPFVELTRLLGNNNNGGDSSILTVAQDFIAFFVDPVLSPMMPSLVSLMSSTSQKELGRNLYQRRRVLANSLMRIEQFVSLVISKSASSSTTPLICGCSKIMWNKLKNSILVAGGSLE